MLRPAAANLFGALEGLLDRIVCVLGVVVAAQAPEFIQQYFQRLGGHLAEAQRQLAAYEAAAHAAGKTLAQFAADTAAQPDAGLSRLGTTMEAAIARATELADTHHALATASVWTRPWAFFSHLDLEIARGTAAIFQPAVPTTAEGAIYAAAGLGIAFGLWQCCVRLPLRRWLAPRAPRDGQPRTAQ